MTYHRGPRDFRQKCIAVSATLDSRQVSQQETAKGLGSRITQLHDLFQHRLYYVGIFMRCHQRGDRSFFIRGRQIPVCARCFGILLGPLILLLCEQWLSRPIAAACIVAFFFDVGSQLLRLRESNNWLRLITGILFSASVLFLLVKGAPLWHWNIRH